MFKLDFPEYQCSPIDLYLEMKTKKTTMFIIRVEKESPENSIFKLKERMAVQCSFTNSWPS